MTIEESLHEFNEMSNTISEFVEWIKQKEPVPPKCLNFDYIHKEQTAKLTTALLDVVKEIKVFHHRVLAEYVARELYDRGVLDSDFFATHQLVHLYKNTAIAPTSKWNNPINEMDEDFFDFCRFIYEGGSFEDFKTLCEI